MNNKKYNFRKLLGFVLAFTLIFGITTTTALADEIKIYVNNTEVKADSAPYITNGRTFVPMRFAAEPLGAKSTWDNTTKTATFTKGNTVVKVTMNSATAYVNGQAKKLDAPATNKNGRIYVPIRFVSESLNCTCEWKNRAVYITTGDFGDFKYLGYYFTYNSLGNLQSYKGELTDISHFAYDLKGDGSVAKKAYYQTDKFVGTAQAIAENAGHDIYMLVTGFNKADLTTVLADSTLRAKAISQIKSEVNARGLDGVDIDFESVATDQSANYVAFIKELRQALGSKKLINISIMPRASASQTWLNGYDYAGLANYADTLTIMCYNEHYSGGSPGPVASYGWVKRVVEYALSVGVDSKQIILGLGSYGYDWPAGSSGSSVLNETAKNRAKSYNATIYRDSVSGCPFYIYYTNGVKHTVWFEDAKSLSQKASLAADYNLGGVGFWKLGNITTNIWAAVLKETNHPNAYYWQKQATADPTYPTQAVY